MHTFPNPAALRSQPFPLDSAELALTLLGPSTAMSQLWGQLRRLAPYARTVLLTGSPHAGQDAAARLLLDLSNLPQRPFVTLREGDTEERLGRATTLTSFPNEMFLYLPEVDRLSPAAQHGLLRLLRVRRSRFLSVAAATSEDLRVLAGLGRFSAELAEALGAVRVYLPSLSERVEDLPMLLGQMFSVRSQALLRPMTPLSEDFLRAAMQHSWPGNLRELSEVVESLLAQATPGQELRRADLQGALRTLLTPRPSVAPVRMVKLDAVVQEHICAVLRGCRGNKLRAAEVLGISRSTLYRMLDSASQNSSLSLAS